MKLLYLFDQSINQSINQIQQKKIAGNRIAH